MSVPISVGDQVTFRRRVLLSDILLYAGITGDFSPNHVDKRSALGTDVGRIAHGTLIMGLMSTASSLLHESHGRPTVSYGYDRVRFVRPVRVGDVITTRYTVEELDLARSRGFSNIACTNQEDAVVAVARHITQFLDPGGLTPRGAS
ncbi:MaoC family dehydratase [Acrocarpospora catenulata]|uniref:MaoC family dehydratase n=1 Tax=Acrocarpospora catenulata TaxID=2836182 RepID=UPI001BDA1B52|nr:MaoC/PaaZ C-terminal domain-containing protein [Acrocarpospora catenulata]